MSHARGWKIERNSVRRGASTQTDIFRCQKNHPAQNYFIAESISLLLVLAHLATAVGMEGGRGFP